MWTHASGMIVGDHDLTRFISGQPTRWPTLLVFHHRNTGCIRVAARLTWICLHVSSAKIRLFKLCHPITLYQFVAERPSRDGSLKPEPKPTTVAGVIDCQRPQHEDHIAKRSSQQVLSSKSTSLQWWFIMCGQLSWRVFDVASTSGELPSQWDERVTEVRS